MSKLTGLGAAALGLSLGLVCPAQASGPSTIFGLTRMMYFVMNGFPSSADYQKYFGAEPSTAGLNGVLGTLKLTLNIVEQTLHATLHADCASVPIAGSLGSLSVKDPATGQNATLTIDFASPAHQLPATYANAGLAFDRRVTTTLSTGEIQTIEFSCSKQVVWLQDVFKTSGTPVIADEIFLDAGNNGDGTDLSLDFHRWDISLAPASSDYLFFQLRGAAGGIMNLWAAEAGNVGTTAASYFWRRMAASSHISTQDVSVFSDGVIADSIATALAGGAGTSTAVSGGAAPSGLTIFPSQGCGSFASPDTDAPDATLCAGLPLSAPPTPVIDATGDGSANWVANTMASKMTAAP
jgi:hypothetical protein